MGKNTGKGFRIGQQLDRYQTHNTRTDRWDKFDGSGNHISSKKSKDPYKGVEKRAAKKPPRGLFGLFSN